MAADLANHGWNVAVVERSTGMYGGTCINIGCIPTKALVHYAQVTGYRRPSTFEQYAEEFKQAILAKEKLTSLLREKNFKNLDDRETVTVYAGEASFRSPYEIVVKTDTDSFLLEGEKIFINAGATTIIPTISGIEDNPYVYTSTSIMELEKLPRHLVIVGGGYIGLEFASMFAGFGSEVTILEAGEVFIPREDRDIADSVKSTLEKKGITIHLNTVVQTIEQDAERATVICRNALAGDNLRRGAEAVLLATGRKPNTESLNLQAAGIRTTNRGAIEVDSKLRTNIPNIWAIGDVHGGLQFTYLSLDDYRIIREELFGNGFRSLDDREAVAYSVFIDPPLAHVGLNETQARKMEKNIKVASLPAAANTWMIIPLGIAAFVVFYLVFRFAITKFDLKTPGREDDDEEAEKKVVLANNNYTEVASAVLAAVGGKENVKDVGYCATRLRFEVKDNAKVDEKAVKAAGAAGVIRPSKNACQVIIGTKVQFVYDELKKML